MKTNLNTREKDFHHRLFQRYITGEDNLNAIIFHVPIGNAKKTNLIYFHYNYPAIKYVQHDKSTCVFIRLSSALYNATEHVAEKDIASRLESSLKIESSGYLYWINFPNKIMKDSVRKEGYQHLCYKFDILNDISDHMTLVKLIDTAINVNHAVSIIGCWIYDSNHKRALPLIK